MSQTGTQHYLISCLSFTRNEYELEKFLLELIFLYFCHTNYSNSPRSFLRICFMLTILKDLGLLNAIGLQLCTVLIPAHQKAGRSHEMMTSRADRPSKTCGSWSCWYNFPCKLRILITQFHIVVCQRSWAISLHFFFQYSSFYFNKLTSKWNTKWLVGVRLRYVIMIYIFIGF
jgi:hypothetical protein